MALTLYVDTARWRAHHKHVQEQFPGLVPVCKGNGYGFGHERLAEEATRLGSDVLAVGTTYEGRPHQGLLRRRPVGPDAVPAW
ncbi:alanine racemase [Streptomyces ambofaciens]